MLGLRVKGKLHKSTSFSFNFPIKPMNNTFLKLITSRATYVSIISTIQIFGFPSGRMQIAWEIS